MAVSHDCIVGHFRPGGATFSAGGCGGQLAPLPPLRLLLDPPRNI